MDTNKAREISNRIELACDSILNNVVNFLSDKVYVEFSDNFYIIKSYIEDTQNEEKQFVIKINETSFDFSLQKINTGMFILHSMSGNNTIKNEKSDMYKVGNFTTDISPNLFKKYEQWFINKIDECLLEKIKILENNLYKNFKIENKVKRKKVNNILKKEDL